MKKSPEELREIFDATDGQCNLCGKALRFENYGLIGVNGAWEIDHSVARAKGGTDHGNNLRAACPTCNRSKGAKTTKDAREKNGLKRRLESRPQQIRRETTFWKRVFFFASFGLVWINWKTITNIFSKSTRF